MEQQKDDQEQDRSNEALTNPYIENFENERVYPLSSLESTNQYHSPYIDPEVFYPNNKINTPTIQQQKETTEDEAISYAVKENNVNCCCCIFFKITLIMLAIIFIIVYFMFFD